MKKIAYVCSLMVAATHLMQGNAWSEDTNKTADARAMLISPKALDKIIKKYTEKGLEPPISLLSMQNVGGAIQPPPLPPQETKRR